jgi:hypothetical protein
LGKADIAMPRRLKVFETHIGFYEMIVAAPSMKAAAEAWGANQTLFKQGFAAETQDRKAAQAALAQPGIVLKRPYGQGGDFKAEPDAPSPPKLSARQKKAMAQSKQAHRHKEEQDRKRKTEAERKAIHAAKEQLAALAREEADLRKRRRQLKQQLQKRTG